MYVFSFGFFGRKGCASEFWFNLILVLIFNASYFSEERTRSISSDEPITAQQNKCLQVRRFLAKSVILVKRKFHFSSSAFYNQLVQKKSVWVLNADFCNLDLRNLFRLLLLGLRLPPRQYATRVWPIGEVHSCWGPPSNLINIDWLK